MIEVQSQQGVVLAITSLACLGCIYALCLCCRKKSSMQQEDNDLYDQDPFILDGKFTGNKQSNTVIRQNQRERLSTSRESMASRPAITCDMHWSYQNLPDGIMEPTYVDPIPNSIYVNGDETDLDTGTYGNVFPTKEVQHDSDSCNYENLKNESEEESDYVNAPNK
ncbi:LAT2 domain-containing protein isoform X1 [Pseudorasbora parva]|uniref:LAT2 domain-containing protein isoform X1 n=1 Tax=Pseudorasbora parva TaxID=51549 RepID=UPI00351F60FF